MSGMAWKYSHLVDEEDLEILRRDFITFRIGTDYYNLEPRRFARLAKKAGAFYKLGKMVLVNRRVFDAFLREHYQEDLDWHKKG